MTVEPEGTSTAGFDRGDPRWCRSQMPRRPGRPVAGRPVPQGGVEVGGRHVEEQSLGRSRGNRCGTSMASSAADIAPGRCEEAAGEHLERQMPSGGGKLDAVQERFRVHVVESPIDVGDRHGGQRGGGAGIQPRQIRQSEMWGCAARMRSAFHGGVRGRPREAVAPTVPIDQRVVLDRARAVQLRVAAAQQLRAGCSTDGRTRGTRGSSRPRCHRAAGRQPPTRPPRYGSRSTRSTVTPRSASPVAAARPAMPAPTTATCGRDSEPARVEAARGGGVPDAATIAPDIGGHGRRSASGAVRTRQASGTSR